MSLSSQLKTAKDNASTFIKLKSGESVRLHFVTPLLELKNFVNCYLDKGIKVGDTEYKVINLPVGSQLPGYKLNTQWAAEVIDVDTGRHAVYQFGPGVAEDILKQDAANRPKAKKDEEGAGMASIDIVLSREGVGRNTEWGVASGATQYEGEVKPTIDLDAAIPMTPAEVLAKLPAPTQAGKGSLSGGKVSQAQAKLISDLMKRKELSTEAVTAITQRRFNIDDLDALTVGQASELIETLQGM